MNWKLAARAAKMNPSVLREILKVTERPGIISLAGGLPSPKTFPIQAFADACAEVLHNDGQAALQYAASEGYAPLRQAVADMLPWDVDASQVLITTGSQQGLDLVAKVLIDPGSKVLVETPTYLGALQAFGPMEPHPVGVASDDDGVVVEDLVAKAKDARFVYLLPNFQNPTGRTMTEERRAAVSAAAAAAGLPIVEDNPYGELWFDEAPPLPLAAREEVHLALFLLTDMADPRSPYRAYYDVLPPTLFSIPVFWREEELAWLRGSLFLSELRRKRTMLQAEYATLCAGLDGQAPAGTAGLGFGAAVSEQRYLWARALVGSRNFGLAVGGAPMHVMAPYADMFNHTEPGPDFAGGSSKAGGGSKSGKDGKGGKGGDAGAAAAAAAAGGPARRSRARKRRGARCARA